MLHKGQQQCIQFQHASAAAPENSPVLFLPGCTHEHLFPFNARMISGGDRRAAVHYDRRFYCTETGSLHVSNQTIVTWLDRCGFKFDDNRQLIRTTVASRERENTRADGKILLTTLMHEDVLIIKGQDAAKFLHGQTTCDVNALSPGESITGACCNPKGRMIANFRLFCVADNTFCLTLPRGQAEILHQGIQKYAVFYKVTFDCAQTPVRFYVQAREEDVLQIADAGLPAGVHLYKTDPVQRMPGVKEVQLWLSDPALFSAVKKQLAPHVTVMPSAFYELIQIRNGLPRVEPGMSGMWLPQDCNMDITGGISFKKGCYTGQEIVARLHYRGTPKNRTFCFSTTQQVVPGDELGIDKNRVTGRVVNSCFDEQDQRHWFLACVRVTDIPAGIRPAGTEELCALQSLPYHADLTK